MTGTQKFLVHLEMVIWDSLPEGTRMNAAGVNQLIRNATPDQKIAALIRGIDHAPIIFPDDVIEDMGQ